MSMNKTKEQETILQAVIFDLDGVITKTARLHSQAWKELFNTYLEEKGQKNNQKYSEFRHDPDYLKYVDGKPRYDGVKSFLDSRDIDIPWGSPDDPPEKETICGLGNRKNELFRKVMHRDGVDVFPSTIELVKSLSERGIPAGVASSSKNCQEILQAAGIESLFGTRVDGIVYQELRLNGKPEPDIFLKACENLGVHPAHSVVVEDAVSGVQAGARGHFGLVIGIARESNADELKKNGADVVVTDLGELDGVEEIIKHMRGKSGTA